MDGRLRARNRSVEGEHLMRVRIAERGGPALAILGRLFHVLPNDHETTIETRGLRGIRQPRPALLTP